MSRVVVTGMGIVSALGIGVDENLKALLAGRSGIGHISLIDTIHQHKLVVGEVGRSNAELAARALPNDIETGEYSRSFLLGLLAAKEATKDLDLGDGLRSGLISATSIGGMGLVENYFDKITDFSKPANPRLSMDVLEPGDSTERIADSLGIKHSVTTLNTACSSSANAIMLGARMIKHGLADRIVAGGTDSLSRFSINGFLTLQNVDSDWCKPFDARRNGLNLGEGAGYLVLESERAAAGKKPLAFVTGYGNANDAYHQTASSPEGVGAFLAMQKALTVSSLPAGAISYINAHGTATEVNDLSEGIAVQRIFGNKIPPLSSTKAFTGHTLAAAGGLEAVFSILAIQQKIIFPNLNGSIQMPELQFETQKYLKRNAAVQHVMSNSFGFGGNTTSLIFSAI